MSDRLLSPPQSYDNFLHSPEERIRRDQVEAALAINRELILLYRQIDRFILKHQQIESWGTKVAERLDKDLKSEFPDIKGFSLSNLS